jgi:hypothetical protein
MTSLMVLARKMITTWQFNLIKEDYVLVITHVYLGDVYLYSIAEFFTPEEVEAAIRLAAIREQLAQLIDSL